MADGKPGRGSDQFPLRLPDGMRDVLKKDAAANDRSMNTEIVRRLEEYEHRLNDIRWLKKEMARLRDDLAQAQSAIKAAATKDIDRTLGLALPVGLFRRIELAAQANERTPFEEVVQALEAAFPPPPPFSLDWFNEEWIARILAAPAEEREDLVSKANAVLMDHGGKYEVWLGKTEEGDPSGSVILSRRIWREAERVQEPLGLKNE